MGANHGVDKDYVVFFFINLGYASNIECRTLRIHNPLCCCCYTLIKEGLGADQHSGEHDCPILNSTEGLQTSFR